jgi:peptide/nickel transport system ATP-binding protein
MDTPLVQTKNLKKYFRAANGSLHAVDNINLSIQAGSTLGVVGESGCGKSTLGRVILRLLEPTAGEIFYNGNNITHYDKKHLLELRKKMQIIFQDPFASLNPRMTISELIMEPILVCHTLNGRESIENKVCELMDTVGLTRRYINTYPHELDGGRRQRIGIARALALDPQFIVCDEPVSALDVSIQAQILNILMDLQESKGLTYLFITHNLSVVKHISNEIMVMYQGECVEYASSEELLSKPLHPYTKALLDSVPIPKLSSRTQKRHIIEGEITSPINPKPGCRFASRCEFKKVECCERPIPEVVVGNGHTVKCVLVA